MTERRINLFPGAISNTLAPGEEPADLEAYCRDDVVLFAGGDVGVIESLARLEEQRQAIMDIGSGLIGLDFGHLEAQTFRHLGWLDFDRLPGSPPVLPSKPGYCAPSPDWNRIHARPRPRTPRTRKQYPLKGIRS